MKNEPLFARPQAPDLTLSKALETHRAWRGTYAAYRPVKRVQCDECLHVLHEAGGKGEPPRGATSKRSTPGGNLVLCTGHAALWRDLDGVGKRPERAPKRGRR